MKVICIDGVNKTTITLDNFIKKQIETPSDGFVYEGEVYTVVYTYENKGYRFYKLSERPNNYNYLASKFIPLSEIDEMELSEVNQSPCTA